MTEDYHVFQDENYRLVSNTGERYVSVSRLLTDLQVKEDFSYLPESVQKRVRHAAQRGKDVEDICYRLLKGEEPVVSDSEIAARVNAFIDWVDDYNVDLIQEQLVVWNRDSRTAGVLDLYCSILSPNSRVTKNSVVDIKCTSKAMQDWPLQVACYQGMLESHPLFGPSWVKAELEGRAATGALHINPRYKRGYIYRPYDMVAIQYAWDKIRQRRLEAMEQDARVGFTLIQTDYKEK